jgi:hypothetical protein
MTDAGEWENDVLVFDEIRKVGYVCMMDG